MGYLITKIILCLLAAFLLGLMLGWLLRHQIRKSQLQDLAAERDTYVTRGQSLVKDREELNVKFSKLERESAETNARILHLSNKEESMAAELDRRAGDLDKLEAERDSMSAELDSRAGDLEKLEAERDSMAAELDRSAADLEKLEAERDSMSAELDRRAADLEKLESERDSMAAELGHK